MNKSEHFKKWCQMEDLKWKAMITLSSTYAERKNHLIYSLPFLWPFWIVFSIIGFQILILFFFPSTLNCLASQISQKIYTYKSKKQPQGPSPFPPCHGAQITSKNKLHTSTFRSNTPTIAFKRDTLMFKETRSSFQHDMWSVFPIYQWGNILRSAI